MFSVVMSLYSVVSWT